MLAGFVLFHWIRRGPKEFWLCFSQHARPTRLTVNTMYILTTSSDCGWNHSEGPIEGRYKNSTDLIGSKCRIRMVHNGIGVSDYSV